MQTQKRIVAGIDEAGRGPLAGPVIAGAVILNPKKRIKGLADSKVLTQIERERLFDEIRNKALAWSIGRATVSEIDRINILQATFLAMRRAFLSLSLQPHLLLIDGNQRPPIDCETKMIIDGDQLEPCISAASIIAKVFRDRIMRMMDKKYPQYGFAQHKGYSTSLHMTALNLHGPCRIHRRSFAPVAQKISQITMDFEVA